VGLFVEPWKAVVLLVYIVVYQQVEGSVLQPLVYSKAVQLNGLVILIALLVGAQLLGIPGALLAIPVAEIIRIVVTELLAYRRTTQEASVPFRPQRQAAHQVGGPWRGAVYDAVGDLLGGFSLLPSQLRRLRRHLREHWCRRRSALLPLPLCFGGVAGC
jgi:hypothetical protein